jgi:hypothetical protein
MDATATETKTAIKVNVSYGPNAGTFDARPGTTVQELIADGYIQEVCGYTCDAQNNIVTVDGKRAEGSEVIRDGQTVEVIRQAGQKA